MDSPDPIDAYFQNLYQNQGGMGQVDPDPDDPIEAYFQSLGQSSAPTPAPPQDDQGWVSRILEGAGNVAGTLGSMVGDAMQGGIIPSPTTQFNPETVVASAGIWNAGLIDPLAGVLGLPGAFMDRELLTDKAANYMMRARDNLRTTAEQNALDAGLSDNQISDAYSTGNFIGFIAPVSASVKAASLMLRAPAALGSHLAAGTLVTDIVAGAIYGGVFKSAESGTERGKQMLEESAMFGVGRIVLNAAALPFRAYRVKRMRDMAAADEVNSVLGQMENGLDTPLIQTEQGAGSLMRLLSEENYISSSAAAQGIMSRSADEAALVQGILDVHRARGSGGILRSVRRDIGEVNEIIDRFRGEFPGLKFDLAKNVDEGYDIVFGTKGLNNKQRTQLKKDGRFEGQRVYRDGVEHTYVGKASRPEYVKLARADGTVVEVKAKKITDIPSFEEEFIPGPDTDALFQDFRRSLDDNTRQLASAIGAIPEGDLIQAVREGKVKLDDAQRRAFDVGGAIVYPEELGFKAGEDGISAVILSRAPQTTPASVDPFAAGPGEGAVKAMVSRNASRGANGTEKPWRITYFGDDMVPAGHQSVASIDEALATAQQQGWGVNEVVTHLPTAKGTAMQISRTGTEFANILEPPSIARFEDIFDNWFNNRGFMQEVGPKGPPADYDAMRTHFATRLRKEMWDAVPEPDRKVFESIRKELDDLLDAGDLPIEQYAGQKGFHAERMPDGTVELREVNTGMRLKFGNERVAGEALRNVVRNERDLFGGLMSLDSNGMPSISGGFRGTDGDWSFGPQIFAKEFLENIPFAAIRNVRDWLISIEKMSNVPLFSQGFDLVDTGLSRMRNKYEPWARQIEGAWKGLSVKQKVQVAEFWQDIEGQDIPLAQAVKMAKERGLSTRQITAFTRSRAIFDEGYKMAGISGARYIHNYYARVRPWVEKNNTTPDFDRIFGVEGVPAEFRFSAEMSRTGEMAMVEMDPEVVMHKWFRSMFFNQEVKPHWDKLAQLVDTGWGPYKKPALRVRDLPQAQVEQIRQMNPHVDMNDPVLAKPIRDVIAEYLTIVRGNPGTGLATLRRFGKKMFNSLGVDADERILEEFYNTGMSSMYGAAMAARPSLVARNMTQTMWNLYPRLGSRFSNQSLAKAMTTEGLNEAIDAGAIRLTEAGVPYGDAIFENMMSNARIEGSGPFSSAVAAAVRVGLRAGYVSRKFAEKMLIPYSGGEQMSRGWAYHWQKMHTERVLNAYETRRIGWDKFSEDAMPMFSAPVKARFEDIYRYQGKEQALRFIGKMASDETHFIYGVGAQPAWMQRPLGRMFGMFGTWPLWAVELYGRRAFSGTVGQQAAFWARTVALTGMFGNMMVQSGVDMWNWISPLGTFGWAGGPMADHAINVKRIIDAPIDQKGAAMKRLAGNVGRLALPGQLFFNDLHETLQYDNPRDQFMRMMMGRPVDQDHYAMRYLFSGDEVPNNLVLQDPETEDAIDNGGFGVLAGGLDIPNLNQIGALSGKRTPQGTSMNISIGSSGYGQP